MALCGHPDSGTLWEEHCDKQVKKAGFDALGLSWPSCYFHRKQNLFLVIYVDDFKMAGPNNTIKEGWRLLRGGLGIEEEARVDEKGVHYLGCKHIKESVKMHDGGIATTMVYDMGDFLQQCVDKYRTLAATVGPAPKLRRVVTPFLGDDSSLSPQGAPAATGPIVECPWCKHT